MACGDLSIWVGRNLAKNIWFEVGVGDKVKLWTDLWYGESPLQLTFLNVYGMASNKEASVSSSLDRLGIKAWRSWDVHFIRRPNDWEMGGVDDFLHTLGSNLPPTKNGDRMQWKLTKNGDFDVRSFYNKLRRPLHVIFPSKGIWKVKAPRRVSFFVWTAMWDKILTGDNLRGRGMDFVDWCIMCRCNGETADHLLLHCGKAHRLWSLVFRSFGFSWVLLRTVANTLFGWWNWPRKHSSSIWNLALLCLMWCLWREKNWRTFENLEISDDQYWLLSVALNLTGLGLGESPLVTLSLCWLALSFVFSIFSFLFSLFIIFFIYIFSLPHVFLHKAMFLNIYPYYLSKFFFPPILLVDFKLLLVN